jgi:hypothetical protein
MAEIVVQTTLSSRDRRTRGSKGSKGSKGSRGSRGRKRMESRIITKAAVQGTATTTGMTKVRVRTPPVGVWTLSTSSGASSREGSSTIRAGTVAKDYRKDGNRM